MSIIQGTAKGGSASFYDYPIGDSLRFDGSSYLRKDGPSTSMSTWTWSIWLKNSSLSGARRILRLGYSSYYYLSVNAEGATGDEGKVSGGGNAPTSVAFKTTQQFRDLSAWYHIAAVPTGVYINGNLILSHASLSTPSGEWWSIGSNQANNTYYFNGYMANIQFIDGQALDPYFFGEFKDNIWVPYNAFSTAGSGTATASDGDTATDSYGTNGFHLDFADSSNIGNDVSGNNNDWTVN